MKYKCKFMKSIPCFHRLPGKHWSRSKESCIKCMRDLEEIGSLIITKKGGDDTKGGEVNGM